MRGRLRRLGQLLNLGGRSGGNPRQQGCADLGGAGQADEHVERHARIVGEPAPHIVATVAGQRSDESVLDRGISGEVGSDTGVGVHGELSVHLRQQVAASGECPAKQRRRVIDEADDGMGGCGRVLQCHSLCLVHGGLVGAVTGVARQQIAVVSRALRVVHERRLFAVADQASQRRGQALAGEQCRQQGWGRRLVGCCCAAHLGVRSAQSQLRQATVPSCCAWRRRPGCARPRRPRPRPA
ncbi:hypothetical protein QFZ76_009742 [Streptomyces sp. V4I2]|nr:hypothetical protein [Streptomyces sp. V4I2]